MCMQSKLCYLKCYTLRIWLGLEVGLGLWFICSYRQCMYMEYSAVNNFFTTRIMHSK